MDLFSINYFIAKDSPLDPSDLRNDMKAAAVLLKIYK